MQSEPPIPSPPGRPPGMARRVIDVAIAGLLVAALIGLVEAAVVLVVTEKSVFMAPEKARFLRRAVLEYAILGAGGGLLLGLVCEALFGRRLWRRRSFYLLALPVPVLFYISLVHYQVNFGTGAAFSLASLLVSLLFLIPGALIIFFAWWFFVRRPAETLPDSILSRRVAGVLALPLLVAAVWPMLGSKFSAGGPHGGARASLPNVLMIVMDTTRLDRLSVYGYDRPTTPALERLAADGVIFTQAYSAAPWTLPSHASMFTGLFPSEHQAHGGRHNLDPSLGTLAEHMKQLGFLTMAISKKPWLSVETGVMRGFEHFDDLHYVPETAIDATFRFVATKHNLRNGLTDKGATETNHKFLGLLRRYGNDPFFAFLNYNEPHNDYEPPSPYREEYLGDRRATTPYGRKKKVNLDAFNSGKLQYSSDEMEIFSDLYDAAVAYQDHRLGQLLDAMRERGILDKTLIIVTADHGELLGEHGVMGHSSTVYNELIHVPLILRFPGVIQGGVTVDSTVETRRIWPMIDEVLTATAPVTGERLALVLAEGGARGGHAFCELGGDGGKSSMSTLAVMRDRLKLVRDSKRGELLFDVAADPGELRDIALERPQDAERLRTSMDSIIGSLVIPTLGEQPEMSEDLKRNLRAVGYLQ